jgi:two-component system, NarL family, response regulator DevR
MQRGPVARDGLIRVLVVDDHEVVAAGFGAVLGREPGFEVTGIVTSREAALRRVEEDVPDVVLLHADMRGGGVELCSEIRTLSPDCRCLLYGSQAEERVVLDTVRSGAGGFLLTSAPLTRIPAALRAVAAGESFLDPGVTQLLFQHLRQPDATDPIAFLSPSERELLRHLSGGLSNREIAARMYLSEKTVKNYVSRLLRKLDLRRRTEAMAFSAAFADRPLVPRPGGPELPVAPGAPPPVAPAAAKG